MDHEIAFQDPGASEVISDLRTIIALMRQVKALGGGLGAGGMGGGPGGTYTPGATQPGRLMLVPGITGRSGARGYSWGGGGPLFPPLSGKPDVGRYGSPNFTGLAAKVLGQSSAGFNDPRMTEGLINQGQPFSVLENARRSVTRGASRGMSAATGALTARNISRIGRKGILRMAGSMSGVRGMAGMAKMVPRMLANPVVAFMVGLDVTEHVIDTMDANKKKYEKNMLDRRKARKTAMRWDRDITEYRTGARTISPFEEPGVTDFAHGGWEDSGAPTIKRNLIMTETMYRAQYWRSEEQMRDTVLRAQKERHPEEFIAKESALVHARANRVYQAPTPKRIYARVQAGG